MAHRDNNGLGKIIYSEWLIPIIDYYQILNKSIAIYEILLPLMISVICTGVYYCSNKISLAVSKLSDILPDVIAILIGFTFTFITLILTSSGSNIERLKQKETDKKLHSKKITMFQELHIQFTHSLFTEIVLMLLIFLYLFLSPIFPILLLDTFFLLVYIVLILNVFLSILRGITNLYFSFYDN